MARNQIELELIAETKKAVKSVDRFGSQTKSTLQSVQKGFSALKVVAAGAVAVIGARAIIGGLKSVTEAASRQEDAVNTLNTALRTSGEFSQAASDDMQAFASSIQAVTKFGDEAIIEQLSLAKAFGATNEQAKLVATASTELAAATGKSLQEATQQISKTLGGYAGELGEVNPAIKNLTESQLKNGEAARVLIEQYGGSAQAQINTFSGATTQLSNTFGDLLEEIGFLITRNPAVVAAVKELTGFFKNMIGLVQDNAGEIGSFITTLIKMAFDILPPVIRGMGFVATAFQGIGLAASSVTVVFADFVTAALKIDIVNTMIDYIIKGFQLVGLAVTRFSERFLGNLEAIVNAIDGFVPGMDGVADAIRGARDAAGDFGDDLANSIADDKFDPKPVIDSMDDIREKALEFGEKTDTVFDGVNKGIESVADEAEKTAGRIDKIQYKGLAAGGSGGGGGEVSGGDPGTIGTGSSPSGGGDKAGGDGKGGLSESDKAAGNFFQGGGSGGAPSKNADPSLLENIEQQILAAIAPANLFVQDMLAEFEAEFPKTAGFIGGYLSDFFSNFSTNLAQGEEGAKKAVTGALSAGVGEAFGPAVGKAAGPIFDLLAQGPEATKAAIEGFADGMPDVIDAMVEAIPVFVETLADKADEIIIALAQATPRIAIALARALANPALYVDFAKAIAIAIVQGIAFEIQKLGPAFSDFSNKIAGGTQQLQTFFQELPQKLGTELPNAIGDSLKSGIENAFSAVTESLDLSTVTDQFAEGIKQGAGEFINSLVEEIKGALPNFGGGGGSPGKSATGVVNKAGKGATVIVNTVLGRGATGGEIPAGFPNDTFTAALSSGELVLPPGDTKRLSKFLDNAEANGDGSNASMGETNALLRQMIALLANGQTIEVDGRKLADVMRDMNQRNLRTA